MYVLCPSKGDKDLQTVTKYLTKLSESDLENLGLCLGLYLPTFRRYGNVSLARFRFSLIHDWISEKDNVKGCGGATWSLLVNALRDEEMLEIALADKIEAEQMGRGGQEEQAGKQRISYAIV